MSHIARLIRHKTMQQFFAYGFLNGLSAAFALLCIPFITKHLPPAAYGHFGIAMALIALFAQVFQLGLTQYSAKVFHEQSQVYKAQTNGMAAILMLCASAFALIILMTFKSFIPWFNQSQNMLIAALVLNAGMLATWSLYTTTQQFRGKAITTGLSAFFQSFCIYACMLAIIFTAQDSTWQSLIYAQAGVQTVLTIIILIWLRRTQALSAPSLLFFKNNLRKLLSFSLPLIPFMVGTTLMITADRLLVEHMIGPNAAGLYTLAYQIASVVMIIGLSLNNAWRPWCLQYMNEHAHMGYKKPLFLVICMTLLLTVFSFIYGHMAHPLFSPFIPASYTQSFSLTPLMAVSVALFCGIHYLSPFYLHASQTRTIGKSIFITAVLNIILNLALIPHFGMMGAVLGTLISTLMSLSVLFIHVRKLAKPISA